MSEPVTATGPNLAIFDLDYTLTIRGTWGRFVWRAVRFRPHVWLPLLFAAGWTQFRYKRGAVPRVRVKQAMMRWAMPNWSKERIEKLANEFADDEVARGLRPGGIAQLQAHRDAGDNIMIVSAAVDVIVSAIAERLNIKHWLATDMAWNNGRLSPDFASPNCYGAEKVTRLNAYLAAHPALKQSNTVITMYSDSHSDLDIMQSADVAIAVNPNKRLLALSKTHGFDVVDWMQS